MLRGIFILCGIVLLGYGCSSKSKSSKQPATGGTDGGGTDGGGTDAGPTCTLASECAALPNAVVGCVGGACVLDYCLSGFEDCDGTASNGCEVNTGLDPANCGGCSLKCLPNHTAAVCASGECLTSCDSGFADCNNDGTDGCEASLSSVSSCGGCGTQCKSGEVCDATKTPAECAQDCGSNTLCGTTCADTQTSTEHCGGCNSPCSGAQATFVCNSGVCAKTGCTAGFDDCDAEPKDCETDVLSSKTHCGACNAACAESCVAGVCDPVTSVATGLEHSCAVHMSGKTQCWGNNLYFQLGDGSQLDQAKAVTVPGVTATRVAASAYSTCVINSNQKLQCWGRGSNGELGNGASLDSKLPVAVSSDTVGFSSANFVDIGAGKNSFCALDTAGAVWCWGRNDFGQVGNGTTTGTQLKAAVVTGVAATALGVGTTHACAVVSGGGVKCWGGGLYGALGNGASLDSGTPVSVSGLSSVTQVAAGSLLSCARTSSGQLYCWGNNNSGGLGDGTNTPSSIPKLVSLPAVATSLTVGTAVIVNTAQGHFGWGSNVGAELGLTTGTTQTTPVALPVVPAATSQVAHSDFHSCALHGGRVSCWGHDAFGQLGARNLIVRTSPSPVSKDGSSALGALKAVAAGGDQTCILSATSVECVGRNWGYQTGQIGTLGANAMLPVSGLSQPRQLATGRDSGCAIDGPDGSRKLWCWGLLPPVSSNAPKEVSLSGEPTDIFVGDRHACALVGGVPECFGQNNVGELGRGTASAALGPGAVLGLTGVTSMALGISNTCALKSDETVWCWGYNAIGTVGNGTTGANVLAPVQVTSLTGVKAIAAGDRAHCAIVGSAKDLWCWGNNGNGQLGDGTLTNRSTPVSAGLSGSGAVAMGAAHTCATTSLGGVSCWGSNSLGQLGNGTQAVTTGKVSVTGLASVVALSAEPSNLPRGSRTCALKSDGTAACWGSNAAGKCAAGEAFVVPTAQLVQGL